MKSIKGVILNQGSYTSHILIKEKDQPPDIEKRIKGDTFLRIEPWWLRKQSFTHPGELPHRGSYTSNIRNINTSSIHRTG